MPIVVPFYESNGLSMKDIMILQAVYSIAIVVLEVPSGYLADVIGRKKTLIIGAVFGILGFTTYNFSFGFMGFLGGGNHSWHWSELYFGGRFGHAI